MSSDLQSALNLIQLNDYVSLIIVTTVIYDYFLTLSREVNYVWLRPWTWISTIFLLVRYLGLSLAILSVLVGSTFLPGPIEVSTIMYLVAEWEFAIFYNAADFVMILRVYAMWNRSKTILWVLVSIYVAQIICYCVFTGIYGDPNSYISVTLVQLADVSLCNVSMSKVSSTVYMYDKIPRFFLGTLLLVLALIPSLKQSIGMYKATKQWQPNRYMQLLVRDGILYFLVNVLFNIASIIEDANTIDGTTLLVLGMFSYVTICPIMPRFIISIRELYDRDARGHCQGIDSGFGAVSQHNAGQHGAMSAIAFADTTLEDDQIVERDRERTDAIQLEPLGDKTCRA